MAAEAKGRVRLAHAENNHEATMKRFADGQVASDVHVVTDGLASYNEHSLNKRPHNMFVQTKAERREYDALQAYHWTISLLKRWLLGTHAGAVCEKHLQAYLDGKLSLDHHDKTYPIGFVGLWTKADSLTEFDDLEASGSAK